MTTYTTANAARPTAQAPGDKSKTGRLATASMVGTTLE